ncbi:hypothetical protein CYMTET_8420 [Cymbomonas tetramitiformis]|uniref:Uncharacterized protein n=1 Tax=Cymbomonas tetramitiformis TaxID=36881 RepID=A0AAE0GTI5_9CHLO|nr:hypothetical protein CYMTET_8420 [Cymbomonas tetramitiformis]
MQEVATQGMASRSTTLTHDTDFTVSLAGLRRIQVYPDDYSENSMCLKEDSIRDKVFTHAADDYALWWEAFAPGRTPEALLAPELPPPPAAGITAALSLPPPNPSSAVDLVVPAPSAVEPAAATMTSVMENPLSDPALEGPPPPEAASLQNFAQDFGWHHNSFAAAGFTEDDFSYPALHPPKLN